MKARYCALAAKLVDFMMDYEAPADPLLGEEAADGPVHKYRMMLVSLKSASDRSAFWRAFRLVLPAFAGRPRCASL